jgi:hypothetical protein
MTAHFADALPDRRLRRLKYHLVLDFEHFVVAKPNIGRAGYAANLFSAPYSDDGPGDGGVPQGPRDGYFTWRGVVPLADRAQRLDQPEIAGKERLLEVRAVLPPVVLGETRDPFPRHRAS